MHRADNTFTFYYLCSDERPIGRDTESANFGLIYVLSLRLQFSVNCFQSRTAVTSTSEDKVRREWVGPQSWERD